MAAFDTTRSTYGSARAVTGLSTLFTRAVSAVVAWHDARVTRKALSALSDRELDDIGLVRGDIDHVASTDFIR